MKLAGWRGWVVVALASCLQVASLAACGESDSGSEAEDVKLDADTSLPDDTGADADTSEPDNEVAPQPDATDEDGENDANDTPEGQEDSADGDSTPEPIWSCVHDGDERPDFLQQIGCLKDFEAISSAPLDASIPGARSTKTVVDRFDDLALYFQNTDKYQIHWQFAKEYLSGQGKPVVGTLSQFNQVEYYSPDRRFLLGAVTFYEEPGVWAYEISPYDTSSAEMIAAAYRQIRDNAFFGKELHFHPTSVAVAAEAQKLPEDVKVITTAELFAGITYQPLNLGYSVGRLRFESASDLDSIFLLYRDIVVLDRVPNDISVVAGIVTGELQTPLSHINVLSQNRGTPNMALIGAMDNAELRALEGKWVRLDVGAFNWTVREATEEEADEWWESNKPPAIQVPGKDLSVTDIRDAEDILDLSLPLANALDLAIPAFGGKASHYGGIVHIGPDVPHPKAFAIPVYHYFKFMEDNGFDTWIDALLDNPKFQSDPEERAIRLAELRSAMEVGWLDPAFEAEVIAKMEAEYPGLPMRFRSSTNAEDLDGFTGAGLYTSKTGIVGDPTKTVANAIRAVWSSVWYFRAFEEREYRSIDHREVGMALLVHQSSPMEDANGVALTANIFDTQGLEPGFYVNVQFGGASVVLPEAGITSDAFVYYYYLPGQPIVYLSHSNLIAPGSTVLTSAQVYQLGRALDAVHKYFAPAYAPKPGEPPRFYGMDTEFKFGGGADGSAEFWLKQARPHPGWGL